MNIIWEQEMPNTGYIGFHYEGVRKQSNDEHILVRELILCIGVRKMGGGLQGNQFVMANNYVLEFRISKLDRT